MTAETSKKSMTNEQSVTNGSVQSFYERMPYPAPLTNLDAHLELLKDPERRRIRSLLMFPEGQTEKYQNILVAGCGTSQAARVALREPDSRVVAIDISATSLNHLRALQRKYRLENLEIHQLSILDVSSLTLMFDQIICTGVLHHLPDPDQGLRCLRDVLKPGGAMQIMVYASYGRTGIYMMQEYCRLLGITSSDQDLKELGSALECLSDDHPLSPLLHKFRDFIQPHALADALLHPQDRAYTVPQLYEWLNRCDMTFGRWMEQAPYLPQCGAIADTPHAARLEDLPEAAQFAAVELFRGEIAQHSFVAYRSDRAVAAQPVQFSGAQWRRYVPVRVPWTKVVRERIPAESTAVLLNPLHKHHDLFLPITAAEYSLFEQINGKKTLGEIDLVRTSKSTADHTLRFFEKLWRYDQIVIDASQSQDVSYFVPDTEQCDASSFGQPSVNQSSEPNSSGKAPDYSSVISSHARC
jgi:SAM-dependent methyltransferase